MRNGLKFCAAAALLILATTQPARAHFTQWVVTEVYSNFNGSIQFVELYCAVPGQSTITDHVVTATSDGVNQYAWADHDTGLDTTNKYVLFATPGFAAWYGGIAADFMPIPKRFFNPNAASITIDWGGTDSITFPGSLLPKDGIHSLTDTITDIGGGQNLVVGVNSPTNFSGQLGSVNLALFADTNLDGKVDITDLQIVAKNWHTFGTHYDGDFNGDGFIDGADLSILARNWQGGVNTYVAPTGAPASFVAALTEVGLPSATNVPEPLSALAIVFGALILRGRIPRRVYPRLP